MIIGVVKETVPGEKRVALVDESVQRLGRKGHRILVQSGAGDAAGVTDAAYEKAGAELVPGGPEVLSQAEIVAKIRVPSLDEAQELRSGAVLTAIMDADLNEDVVERLASGGVSALALERVPRIARAQSMDVLSSMATVAGYQACLMAADRLPKFFPLLMTAAGTISPARVLIIGAGVAGLSAIGTARRLGARVEAFDPRPAAREQVESLGAKFVGAELIDENVETAGGYAREQTEEEKARQKEFLRKAVAATDVIICSALVAGRKAPRVIDEEMVRSMKPGSVIIDLAAEQGGNCELTEPGKDVVRHRVTVSGPFNVPGMLALDASRMFSRNVTTLLEHLLTEDGMADLAEDEISRPCLVAHAGSVWSGGQPAPAGGES